MSCLKTYERLRYSILKVIWVHLINPYGEPLRGITLSLYESINPPNLSAARMVVSTYWVIILQCFNSGSDVLVA
jgi:hypothetical protein